MSNKKKKGSPYSLKDEIEDIFKQKDFDLILRKLAKHGTLMILDGNGESPLGSDYHIRVLELIIKNKHADAALEINKKSDSNPILNMMRQEILENAEQE